MQQNQGTTQQGAAQATPLAEVGRNRELAMPDLKIDMFSLRGFELAQRIARAFATSDAVPAQFRAFNLKKTGQGEEWIENPAALGNCLVAVETAQAVGMSITAVMQNANIIEGKLSWSGKFVIAAVNASGRFTPLRFHVVNKGKLKAKYKEKTGWDSQARRPVFTDREVEIENIECTAWALPAGFDFPKGVATLDQAKAAGLPVIEGAPVSIAMAVEEGWYAKAGSKWQTGMKHLMLQYRAGAYFGNIHAPDVVMGMGRTTEEVMDVETIDLNPPPAKHETVDTLRAGASSGTSGQAAEVVEVTDRQPQDDGATGENAAQAAGDQAAAGTEASGAESAGAATLPALSAEAENLNVRLAGAQDLDQLAEAMDLVNALPSADERTRLTATYRQRFAELSGATDDKPAAETKPAAPAKRTRRAQSIGTAPE